MRPLLVVAALVVVASLAGCKTPPAGPAEPEKGPAGETKPPSKAGPSPVDEMFARINASIDGDKLDEASESLKSARQLAPGDPRADKAAARLAEAYAQRAQILTNEGKLIDAQAPLRKALELDRAHPKARGVAKQLAQALADRAGKWRDEGKLTEAQGAVLSALEFDPENAAANKLAKRIAQDYALRAANQLDEGKEADARISLDAARKLDAKNELANTLHGTLVADPEQELGTKFFRYTVKPGDKLSRLAELYLKDQYKFYLLARYNGIAVPRGLKAGQVIKVPGTKPIAPPSAPSQPPPQPRTAPDQPVAPPPPPQAERAEQIQRYDRQARDCYRRQDLDCCIASWDKVLQLDPANEPAERERDRCVRLREVLSKEK